MKGGRVFCVLLRNEWFKARRRLAFWLALGFFALAIFAEHSWQFFQRSPDFRLPAVWGSVFTDSAQMLLIFASLTLVLLATTEFAWRTARQNVIDGLSKTQWFWGKVLLLPIVGLAFMGVHILIPVVLAAIRTDFGSVGGPLIPGAAYAAAGGLALSFLSVGSLAFFLSMAIRRTGAALAIWFLWIIPVEVGMVLQLALRFPRYAEWLEYVPFRNATHLLPYEGYVGAADPTPHLIAAAAWSALFIGTAFVWFRRRDL